MNGCKQRALSVLTTLKSLLVFISFGKFSHGLFLNRKLTYATVIGGLLTLLYIVFMLAYTITVIDDVVTLQYYNLDESVVNLQEDT